MQIEAAAWKNLVNDQHVYMMQFCTGSTKETKAIQETLKDWDQTGAGFNKAGMEVMVFKKNFKDTPAWVEWAKNAPFIINEVDKEGSPKRLKTTVVLEDDGKRKCRLCNKPGHNSQTCVLNKNNKNSTKQMGRVNGKNKCKICGQLGHNARKHSI